MEWVSIPIAIALGVAVYFMVSRKTATIYPGTIGLRYRGGRFEQALDPGNHAWFELDKATTVFIVPTVPFVHHGQLLTAMSSDRFSFRITITPVLQITDAQAHSESRLSQWEPNAPHGFNSMLAFPLLNPALSAAVLEMIGRVTLDEFLRDPSAFIDGLKTKIDEKLPGVAIIDLHITDITMPPELRKMFTDVERAKREGLASLERARAEQASLRTLANAARSLQSNPELAQLRLLQVMEGAKGAKTFILGQQANGLTANAVDRTKQDD